jgi:hypothetical protein
MNTTTASQVMAEVALHIPGSRQDGRDLIVPDSQAAQARDLAVTFGAVATEARPSALFGHYVITAWME